MSVQLLLACSAESVSSPDAAAIDVLVSPATTTATIAAAPELPVRGPRYARATIASSLEGALVDSVGAELGPALSQVLKRALVWWIVPASDLRKGDEIEVVYELNDGDEPSVHAVWFRSQKMNKDFEAVRYKPSDDEFFRWYEAPGSELELRLVDGPMREYEQVTSLLRDGRGHKGVDFKAPVGTPVFAPVTGRVARKNWSRRGNGNCLDIEAPNGRHALLLHLDRIPPGIRVGTRVKVGQLVAYSGNTGRSTAPHLHYQLQLGLHGRVLDPFRFHKTRRASLPEADVGRMRQRLTELTTLRSRSS